MTLHVGIVGVSAEGAALCYRTLCAEGAAVLGAAHAHPEVSLNTQSLAAYVDCLGRGDDAGVAALVLRSAEALAAAGADLLICPDNTVHRAFDLVRDRSPVPWLHIAEIVAQEAERRGFRRLAILGTRWLVESNVYPGALAPRGIEWLPPEPGEQSEIDRMIMEELVLGIFRPEAVGTLRHVLQRMSGCDAAVMACTEIPLILDEAAVGMPLLDSTRLLARAALAHATTGDVEVDVGQGRNADPL